MEARPLTQREGAVLDALLAVDFPDVETLRDQPLPPMVSSFAARAFVRGRPLVGAAACGR